MARLAIRGGTLGRRTAGGDTHCLVLSRLSRYEWIIHSLQISDHVNQEPDFIMTGGPLLLTSENTARNSQRSVSGETARMAVVFFEVNTGTICFLDGVNKYDYLGYGT